MVYKQNKKLVYANLKQQQKLKAENESQTKRRRGTSIQTK